MTTTHGERGLSGSIDEIARGADISICPRCGHETEWGWINVECCTRCGWNDRDANARAIERHQRRRAR